MSEKYCTLSLEILRSSLSYDKTTGVFCWLKSNARTKVGQIAGYKDKKGYRRIRLLGEMYFAHKLAFFYVYGVWPKDKVDHENGNRDDNRILNLRQASTTQNAENQEIGVRNTTGFLGVTKVGEKFRATVKIDGAYSHLGMFNTPEEAQKAYISAKNASHTFFNPSRKMQK
jgi:hypothetical protein